MLLLMVGACARDPVVTPADASFDAANADAPYTCRPRVSPAAPDCLALAPAALRGTTPFGTLDVALDYFGAGDCITISHATIGLRGACGEELTISFSYPVQDNGNGRFVADSFDADARFTFSPPTGAGGVELTPIHVAVTRWQEGMGTHDIDITVSTTAPRYAFDPIRVVGTFCDWPYYIC